MNEMPSGVKIPDGANPYRAIVNGVEHAYEAGMITEVAPGVEELINAADNFPPAAEEVQPPFAGGGGGGGGGVMVVHTVYDEEQGKTFLDKTWREIRDAADSMPILFVDVVSVFGTESVNLDYIMGVSSDPGAGNYGVSVVRPIINQSATSQAVWSHLFYRTESEDGYPVYTGA